MYLKHLFFIKLSNFRISFEYFWKILYRSVNEESFENSNSFTYAFFLQPMRRNLLEIITWLPRPFDEIKLVTVRQYGVRLFPIGWIIFLAHKSDHWQQSCHLTGKYSKSQRKQQHWSRNAGKQSPSIRQSAEEEQSPAPVWFWGFSNLWLLMTNAKQEKAHCVSRLKSVRFLRLVGIHDCKRLTLMKTRKPVNDWRLLMNFVSLFPLWAQYRWKPPIL